MELGVLGPLVLLDGADHVAFGGPKQRLVLGLLAARRGQVVSIDELIDGLWPDGPQARPRKTVQVYVTRLRRALGPRADAIASQGGGYRLDPSQLGVDADHFNAEVAAAADGDDEQAVVFLRRALRRWRGDAFADLRDCLALLPSAVELDQRRLTAMHDLFEREVRRRPQDVLAELEQAAEAHPLHEGFAGLLMTAQYRVGRQADALATFRALRRRLSTELGLEPSPAVRRLEGLILRHELAPAAPSGAPPAVVERLRRRVTVVSVELAVEGDEPVDPEVELAVLTPRRRALRAAVLEHGGLIVADAGDGLAACFGYPTAERAVERALRTAVAARRLGDEQVAVRVGVDAGVVVIEGGAGIDHVAGEPLRAATRLRAIADRGEILLGAAAATAAADVVALTPDRDGRAVAGELVTPDPPSAAEQVMFGRDEAVAEIAVLGAAAATRLVPIAVSGVAGIGKTALVEHVVAARGSTAVWLRCDRRHHVTPLHPLRPVVPELFAGGDEPTVRAVIQALRTRWPAGLPMLVVDDLDAADPSTLDLLDALPELLPAGLLLLTTRSADPVQLDGELVPRIALGPLERPAARALAAQLAGTHRLRLDTLNEIADRGGGVPLHVQFLTHAVLDRGGVPAAIPTSLDGSLLAVLDGLGSLRPAVQRLAVLGPAFDVAAVDDVLGGETGTSRDAVDRLVAAGVLRHDDGRYRFTSQLIADAAYDSLLHADRAALHETVAAAMSSRGAPPEHLAAHLEAAGHLFDAAVAWRRASADAVRRAHHREATHHARRALQILDRLEPSPAADDTRRRALTNLAIAVQAIAHGGDELLAVIAAARRAGVGADDRQGRLVLDVMEVSALHERGAFVAATDVAARLVDDMTAAGDDAASAFALQFLGACHVWRGQLVAGVTALERAADLFEISGGSGRVGARAEGAMWSLLGLVACFEDRRSDMVRLLTRAGDVVPAGDGYTRCLVAATAAMADQLADDPAAVRRAVEPIWSLAMDLGSDFWFSWAQVLLGWAIAAEDGEAGLAMMVETLDHSTTIQTRPYFLALLGDRLCEHGRLDSGLARLEEGLAAAAETGERLWEPLLRLTRARWLLAAGDPHGVREGAAAVDLATRRGQLLLARRHTRWVAARS